MTVDSFPTFLRTWLADKKLSPHEAAPLLGVGYVAVYGWLNGNSLPTLTKVRLLAHAFDIDEARLRMMLRRPKKVRAVR